MLRRDSISMDSPNYIHVRQCLLGCVSETIENCLDMRLLPLLVCDCVGPCRARLCMPCRFLGFESRVAVLLSPRYVESTESMHAETRTVYADSLSGRPKYVLL